MALTSCPRSQITAGDCFKLYQYHQPNPAGIAPLLIVFSMINTPSILDIHPERSFIRALLDQGLCVYLLEWCPEPLRDRQRPMADYILDDLDIAMTTICTQTLSQKLHVMGICQGGYFSLCLNALKPARFASIIPVVTPVDFHATGCKWSQYLTKAMDPRVTHAFNNAPYIPGESLGAVIYALDPCQIMQSKWDAWQSCGDASEKQSLFFAIEGWSQDYPDQPTQVMADFFQLAVSENALHENTLVLRQMKVDLKQIQNPILNIYAKRDYFWQVETPGALQQHHQSTCYESIVYDGGHIGVFVGENALQAIPAKIAHFMRNISVGLLTPSTVI